MLFSEPFGQGYPKEDAARKLRDTVILKNIRRHSQKSAVELMNSLDESFINRLMRKQDVIRFILENGKPDIVQWLQDCQRNE